MQNPAWLFLKRHTRGPATQTVREKEKKGGGALLPPEELLSASGASVWSRTESVTFPIFYFTRSGLGDSSDEIFKRTLSAHIPEHAAITFLLTRRFLSSCSFSSRRVPGPERTDNFVHFCGFSETPNQTFQTNDLMM